MRIFLSLMGLLLFIGVHAQSTITDLDHLRPKDNVKIYVFDQTDYQTLSIEVSTIERWYKAESDSIRLSIPGLASVWVYRQDMLAPGFTIQTDDGKVLTGKEYTGVQYLARSGLTSLSVYPNCINAIITQKGVTWNLGPDIRNQGRYILSRHRSDSTWQCHVEDQDDHPENNRPRIEGAEKSALSVSCKVVKIGLEGDFHMFQQLGSTQAVSQHLSTLFNATRRLYQAEGIIVQLGSITVWTTADPYRNLTSASTILLQFATNRPVAQMTDNLLHLVSFRPQNLGGIAYTDVLCNASVRHGFSVIYNQNIALPNYSWSVYVLTHETGHNFGSKHTHWCGWNLPNGTTGRIDSCYAGEGTCGGTTRPRRGTIMSYCHLTSQGIDFNLGFGPVPGNQIRSRLAAASCIATTAGGPCDSLAPPPPPPPTECVSTVQHFTNAQGRSCYRFRIQPGCRYTVNYCRYDGFPQSNPPPISQTPTACGVRLNNYLPTPAELAAGWVEREASPQPSFTGAWYSVRVVAATGPSGLVFFWWP